MTCWGNSLSQTTKLNMSLKNVPVQEVLLLIEEQTDFYFLYQDNVFQKGQKVTIESKNESLEGILQQLSQQTGVRYEISDRQIILKEKGNNLFFAQQKEKTVSGSVSGKGGEAIPGATVVVKGTNNGTITDLNGKFVLPKVPSNAVLMISFVGMKAQEFVVGDQTVFNVIMEEEAIGIDEVVAIGYGTIRKSDLTGSVTSVKSEELVSRPVPTIASALQGLASGVLVRTQSAAPGGKSSIVIRGINSVESEAGPLFVVDGIPMSDISSIAPEDIESLEILKDAAATAIYGSRGSNGVILISSKKGKAGKTLISYSGRYTYETLQKTLDLMNGEEFATVYSEYEKAKKPTLAPENVWYNGSAYDRPTPEQAGEGTDWWDVLTRPGHVQNHQIGISGGSERSTFSASLNYLDQIGMMVGGNYKRFTMRVSNTYEITPWLSSGLDIYITRSYLNSSGENTSMEGQGGTVNAIFKMSPAQKVYTESGDYQPNTLPGTQTNENPLAMALEQTNATRIQKTTGNFYLNFKPTKDLSFKVSAGGISNEGKTYFHNPSTTYYGKLVNGVARLTSNINSYFINENILTYKKTFGSQRINVDAGFTYEQNIYEDFSASTSNYFTDVFKYNNLGAGNLVATPSSSKTKWSLASGLGRINYVLKEKYLLTLVGRYDGCSKFGQGNKWAFFPSVAGAWRVSEESFMNGLEWMTNVKIRASYGTTGNSNIGLYQSLATFTQGNYPFGTTINPGVYLNRLENKDLKWETTVSSNLGVDMRLFDKVNLTVEGYVKKTNDLLMNVNLIETSGQQTALRNVGSLENKGLDISADAVIIDRELKWKAKGSLYLNRNKIIELNGDASQAWRIGKPLGVIRGYILDGILATQEDLDNYLGFDGKPMNGAKLGDYRIIDSNKNGKIDGEDQDIICDPNPDFTYSLGNEFSYKNFSLNIFIYGSQGNQIFNHTARYLTNIQTLRNNLLRDVYNNYWTPERTTNVKYAALGSSTAQQPVIENGSFLRVQNIMLSYNLLLKRIFHSARVYVSAQNLLTITEYSGFDPDISSDTDNNSFGNDRASYPMPKSVTFGVDITL
jgi:TonB-linked SusC/RagA family outer membrane protein